MGVSCVSHGMSTTPTTEAAEVSGRALQSVLDGVTRTCGGFEARTLSLFEHNGLPEPKADEWYPLGRYCGVYEDLLSTTGHNIVERIGVQTARTAAWPRAVDGVGDALDALDAVHRDRHRGGDVGGYEFTPTGERTGRLTCSTPYPVALERGLVRGIGQRFGAETGFVAIEEHTRRGDSVTFDVQWWGAREQAVRLGGRSDAIAGGHAPADD